MLSIEDVRTWPCSLCENCGFTLPDKPNQRGYKHKCPSCGAKLERGVIGGPRNDVLKRVRETMTNWQKFYGYRPNQDWHKA